MREKFSKAHLCRGWAALFERKKVRHTYLVNLAGCSSAGRWSGEPPWPPQATSHHHPHAAELHLHHRPVLPGHRLEVAVRPAAELQQVAQHGELLRGGRSVSCSPCCLPLLKKNRYSRGRIQSEDTSVRRDHGHGLGSVGAAME